MIMQNPGDDHDFFSDFLSGPPAAALHEADAPMTDWRFVPQKIGRRRYRMDIAHASAGTRKPRFRPDRPIRRPLTQPASSTLYFG